MQLSEGSKPATAPHGEPASGIEHLCGPLEVSDTHTIIEAQLIGSDLAAAGDVKASGAFDLCRRLLASGVDAKAALHCYRNGRIALRIKSIGEGARLTIRETAGDGPRVVRWKAFARRDVPAPIRQIHRPVQ